MPVSATRRLMTGGWGSPKLDTQDSSFVLHSPLWRPNMVARGGSIKNGTGTMDVTPQNLAVGANTITVTAAGNFTVYMPEGGTVASGTMTVTGSPVTVSAGIATTITTTGAIGNITCTPSNIIRSKDRNNHALTITGATWGYQGRTFNGATDMITTSTNFNLAALTILFWHKPVDADAGDYSNGIIEILTNTTTGFDFRKGAAGLYIMNVGNGSAWADVSSAAGARIANKWGLIGATITSTAQQIYKNGEPSGSAGAVAYSPSNTVLKIGRNEWGFDTGATFGEVLIFNRALIAQEIQQIYLTTKWRYL